LKSTDLFSRRRRALTAVQHERDDPTAKPTDATAKPIEASTKPIDATTEELRGR
jgi:hypothetical protein